MLRRWLYRLGWLAVTAPLALLATEGLTRALMPQNRDTILEILAPDDTVGYIYEPGARAVERARDYDVAFEINSLGLRDREYGDLDTEAFRVLLIGNSFCVSHGLEIDDSMSRALERALGKRFGQRRVEVVNASNAGYNPYNYWKSYARWAPVIRPDAVVVGILAARDHLCDVEDVRFLIVDGLIRSRYREGEEPRVHRPNPVTALRKSLALNSDFYVLIRNYFYYNDRIQGLFDRVLGRGASPGSVDAYRVDPAENVTQGRELAGDYLRRLRQETDRDGVPLLVLGIPQKADVLEPSWAVIQQNAAALDVAVDRQVPFRVLAGQCQAAGIPLLDLRPAVRTVGADGYFEYDNHWNAVGVAAAAEAIAGQWSFGADYRSN